MAKVYLMKEEDFADLARLIELNYRTRAENANQPWNTLFMADDPRGTSIYDQFRGTWFHLCRWCDEHEINLHKALNG